MAPFAEELVFWGLSEAGVILAGWQYACMSERPVGAAGADDQAN